MLVAIDIAKVRNEVLIEDPSHKRRRRLQVLNNRAEHDRLIEILQAYDHPVICGFEATGNYHRPIAWRLAEAGFEVRLVSSLALARTREALHNSWDKNDPKDAQVMLHMLRIQATQRYHDPLRAGINDVQELSKTHEAIAKAKTEIQHRILTHYLPLYFPEIDRFRGNSRSDWFFAFLHAFPTPASITGLTKEEFVTAAWDVVGRKVSKTQILMDIYETARSSIGLPLPLDAPAICMFRMAGRCRMSRLRTALERYVGMRQGLGYKYHGPARRLSDFVTFMEAHGAGNEVGDVDRPTTELVHPPDRCALLRSAPRSFRPPDGSATSRPCVAGAAGKALHLYRC